MNIISEIQRFNADQRINKLHLMYEKNALLNCLSVSRREISHSMFLSELFKEDSFHEAGSQPLQLLLETILYRAIKQDTRISETNNEVIFRSLKSAILARDLNICDIQVSTEESFNDKSGNNGKVDILITCRVRPLQRENNNKCVEFLYIIIENKIYSKENDSQTQKYYEHFNAFLKNNASNLVDTSLRKGGPRSIHNLYVYLTPASPAEIEDHTNIKCACKEYVKICYQDILDFILDPLLSNPYISQRGKFFIEEYRRSLGFSFENVESCQKSKSKTKINTAIMAIGKAECEELTQLWEDYSELFVAAINETNRSEDEENEDDTEDDNNKGNDGKLTRYDYKGQPFFMGPLVKTIINDHLPEYTFDEINNEFSNVVRNIVRKESNNTCFGYKSKNCTKDNEYVYIVKQWGENRFSKFCEVAKQLWNYDCQEYKERVPDPEESTMLKAFYNKYEKLINTTMEVIKYSGNKELCDNIDTLIKRTVIRRSRIKYSVTLQSNNQTIRNLSLGRLILTVLQEHITNTTEALGYDDIIKIFGIPKESLIPYRSERTSGYFTDDSEIIMLENNEQYILRKSWKEDDKTEQFFEKAKELQYRIDKLE